MITKHRVDTRAKALIKEYSNRGFNYQTVVRLKNREQYNPSYMTYLASYNSKMDISYIDRIMDNLVSRRKGIEYACAFLEPDDEYNNHLHVAWYSSLSLNRKQIAKAINTRVSNLIEVLPIDGKEQAIDYFTKRLYSAGTYNNFYG